MIFRQQEGDEENNESSGALKKLTGLCFKRQYLKLKNPPSSLTQGLRFVSAFRLRLAVKTSLRRCDAPLQNRPAMLGSVLVWIGAHNRE